jgi:hypothetical protein
MGLCDVATAVFEQLDFLVLLSVCFNGQVTGLLTRSTHATYGD